MKYRFYIERAGGSMNIWTHLTRTQAMTLARLTEKCIDCSVTRCGWSEMT